MPIQKITELTDAEIDAAIEVGKQTRFPRLLDIGYDVSSDMFALSFHDGMKLVIARHALQLKSELDMMGGDELRAVTIIGPGSGIEWKDAGVSYYLPSLVARIFGLPDFAALGARGGASRSAAKVAAVQKNGQKGGRPSTKRGKAA